MKKTNKGFVVRFTDNTWLASWLGDSGHTHCLHNARVYKTEHGARIALGIARNRCFTNKKDYPKLPLKGYPQATIEGWRQCKCTDCIKKKLEAERSTKRSTIY